VPLPAYPTLSRSDSDAQAAPSPLAGISEQEEQAGDSLDRESDSGEDGQGSDDGWGDDDDIWESTYLDKLDFEDISNILSVPNVPVPISVDYDGTQIARGPLATHVLEDPFQVMDRVIKHLSKNQPAFRAFCVAFSQTCCV
jgi:hypothetical protein